MSNVLLILVALLLVLLNGFFVAAEFGLVKLRQTRIRVIAKTQGYPGRMLARVHRKLDTYLSACQLGITLASLGLGWIGEPAFASLLAPLLSAAGVSSPEIVHGISFVFAFLVISFLHIVVGELAPKSMAIRNPERIGLWTALPLYGFYWMMYPVIWMLNASANAVLRLAGLADTQAHDSHYSAEELKLILRSSRPGGKFDHDEWNVLAQTLDFGKLEVSDLMRPLHEMVALHHARSHADNLQTMQRTRFSRYPYFDQDDSRILGMIHLKDLFLAQQEGKSIEDLGTCLRPIQFVSPRMPALELLRRFRKGAPHFAIVGSQGQEPLGFLTLDNLLGALVGEIRDEFRPSDNDWTRLDDGSLTGKGSLPIYTLERILGIDIENEEANLDEADSIGGLVLSKLGNIPAEGQQIQFRQFQVVVKKMDGPRIVTVLVHPQSNLDSNDEND
ncbi:MAG: HlyC/CorC family transporter [Herminiimonas sp.]|nr:HlyC/CorC family transporter [Herminiimonas sp.]